MTNTALTEREEAVLRDWLMFGSAHRVFKAGRNWQLDGFPSVYRTKREAIEQWNRYLDALIDRKEGRVD